MDASALVHLCTPGTGSELAATLWNRADLVVTSRAAVVEIPAVLRAGHHAGALDDAAYVTALTAWQGLRGGLHLVELTPEVSRRAVQVVENAVTPVRTDDALHVASALTVAHEELLVAAWDEAVAGAARREGLTVVP
ncbi:PIN domain-containing protein [Paraoerskovia marina]|uniref:PIN domain-containing protein n=1 Tax=Paraoerskovia marina TaxID=545619 RepID=A0A1H1PSR6_9CELL|nr:type II toxin-antitoxin system VapC family toxin [Paraoerskovia marina]SDS14133.1 PIN domain-containing protein [Paraoerskovia marina]